MREKLAKASPRAALGDLAVVEVEENTCTRYYVARVVRIDERGFACGLRFAGEGHDRVTREIPGWMSHAIVCGKSKARLDRPKQKIDVAKAEKLAVERGRPFDSIEEARAALKPFLVKS